MIVGFEIAEVALDLIETATPRVVAMRVKRFLAIVSESALRTASRLT